MKTNFSRLRIALSTLLLASASVAWSQSWLTGGPYLQEVTPSAATVVFTHSIPSLSWIEVREKGQTDSQAFYQTEHGQIKAYRQIMASSAALPVQNFCVRATGLKPGTPYQYRVRGKRVTAMNAEGATLSPLSADNYASKWYDFSTQDPEEKEHHLLVTSDMHNRPDTLKAILRNLDYNTCNHIIYNGDMENYMQISGSGSEEPYKAFINASCDLFAKNKPFEFVRGNHETRGDISGFVFDYFPRESGKLYNAYRWGDLEVVMLDCGEDKVDDHAEYYGMAAYYPYREEQKKWLEKLIKTEEFCTAKYRIAICHFNVLNAGKRNTEFDGSPHFTELMLPLMKAGNVDLVLTGHTHPKSYVRMEESDNDIVEYNFGNHTGMRIDIAQGKINLKIADSAGNVYLDKVIKDERNGQQLIFLSTE